MTIDAPNRDQTGQLRQMWKEAFGDTDAYLDSFFTLAFSPDRCRCVTEAGRVTAALYWFDCSCRGAKLAYLYAVATEKASRGRGLCRKLMADTHAHLEALGYAGTVLVPAEEPLRAMYGRLGYLPAAGVLRFSCRAGESPVRMEMLTKEEYAVRRRELLPEGAVIQEGPALELLAEQCVLAGGEGFLISGWTEDGVFHTEEFLGDRGAAPGILKALGARKGIFRGPGETEPFAMYRPIADGCPVPGYFGIALG